MQQLSAIPDRTDAYWEAMPSEVRRVLRRKLLSLGTFPFMKEVSRHFRDGAWSITPFPGSNAGFSTLGLIEAKGILQKLEAWHE